MDIGYLVIINKMKIQKLLNQQRRDSFADFQSEFCSAVKCEL